MSNDPFFDYNLMNDNIDSINRGEKLGLRVSAEHYIWLCSARSTVAAITHTAGGEVEGRPTSVINILQRIRELVKIEQEIKNPNEDSSGQRREPMEPNSLDAEAPFIPQPRCRCGYPDGTCDWPACPPNNDKAREA